MEIVNTTSWDCVKECKFSQIEFKFSRIKSSGALSSFSSLQSDLLGRLHILKCTEMVWKV